VGVNSLSRRAVPHDLRVRLFQSTVEIAFANTNGATDSAAIAEGESADTSLPFPQQYGLKYFRGGEVFEILDERGRLINENDATAIHSGGNRRTFRLKLDAAQYQLDSLRREQHGGEDVYTTFNIVFRSVFAKTFCSLECCNNGSFRRKSKENNFKAVLETIRDLMNTKMVVPDWLRDVFLGYGNPAASQNIESAKTIDFVDTFIDSEHLRAAFPEYKIKFASQSPIPPFRVSFDGPTAISVESYKVAQFMPYSAAEQKRNHIPFTTVQVKAIQTAMNKGLTMVVGPPGTGKVRSLKFYL
jgi:intron-binding protein aquarius